MTENVIHEERTQMSLIEKLGAKDEAEALVLVASFNKLSGDLMALTGQSDEASMLGTIAGWKQVSVNAAKSKDAEDAHVAAVLATLASDKTGDCVALKSTYENDGLLAFIGAANAAKTEHAEAKALIDGLVKDAKLPPADRGTFESLFASSGILALKAAASVLPKAQISSSPAPNVDPEDGLNERERAMAKKMTPEQKEEFVALRHSKKGDS